VELTRHVGNCARGASAAFRKGTFFQMFTLDNISIKYNSLLYNESKCSLVLWCLMCLAIRNSSSFVLDFCRYCWRTVPNSGMTGILVIQLKILEMYCKNVLLYWYFMTCSIIKVILRFLKTILCATFLQLSFSAIFIPSTHATSSGTQGSPLP
jgi:hypothetical protein